MWCWWCCLPFENTPLSLPTRYDDRRQKFTTSGTFCSWSCMKTYALDHYGLSRGSIMCGHMVMMRKKLYDKIGHIKPAPKRQSMKHFGGNLTIEEFRSNACIDKEKPNTIITTEANKMVLTQDFTKNQKMYEIKNASCDSNQLKLKREKPLKREKNNLESVLGLVIKPKK